MDDPLNKKADEIRELSDNIKETLSGENDFEIDLEELAKLALIAGGVALALYWIARMIFGGSKEEQKSKKNSKSSSRKKDSYLSKLLKEQILLILLAVFKKKILPRLEQLNLKDEKDNL